MKCKISFFLITIILTSISCAPAPVPTPSITHIPTLAPTETQTQQPTSTATQIPSPTATPFITSMNFENCRVINWIEGKEIAWFGVDDFSSIPEENFEVEVNIDKSKVENGLVTLSINNNPQTVSEGTILSIFVFPYNNMDALSTTSGMSILSYLMWYSTLLDTYVHPDFSIDHPYFLNIVNVDMNGAVLSFSFAYEDYCYTNRLKLGGDTCQIDVYPNGSEIAWGKDKDGNIICPVMSQIGQY